MPGRDLSIVKSMIETAFSATIPKNSLYLDSWIRIQINPFSPSHLSSPNLSLHNTYKLRHLVMRK